MNKVKPLIYWPGLRPVSFITKNIVQKYGDDLVFISSPTFDKTFKEDKIEEFEKQLGHKIIWLDNPNDIWERKEEFNDRNLIVHTGWNNKGWLKYDKYMKKKGAKIILTADNNYKGTFRQCLGAIYFRLFLRPIFDGVFITGQSSFKLMRFFGMPENRIFTGLLGSDKDIYFYDENVKKKKEFLFVGQLIKRKNFDLLVEAFSQYKKQSGKFDLRVIGDGSMKELIDENIIYDGFCTPEQTAQKMREATCLIVPSAEDHWPTVFHEAISCGTLIMPSKFCGNHVDLLQNGINGYLLENLTVDEIVEKMFLVENMDKEALEKGKKVSLGFSKKFGRDIYEKSFEEIEIKIC